MNETALEVIFDTLRKGSNIQNLILLSDTLAKIINKYELVEKHGFDNVAKLLRKAYNIIEPMTWSEGWEEIDEETIKRAKQYIEGAWYLLGKNDLDKKYEDMQMNAFKNF